MMSDTTRSGVQRRAVVDRDIDAQRGIARTDRDQKLRKTGRRERVGDAEAEIAGHRRVAAHGAMHLVGERDHPLGEHQQLAARRRRQGSGALTLQDRHADRTLELADALGQRRLGHAETARGGAKSAEAMDPEQGFELCEAGAHDKPSLSCWRRISDWA